MKLTTRKAKAGGFTLIEMLVVLVIIGLLAGLVGPRLFGASDKAKVQTAQAQVRMLKGELEQMRLDIDRFPTPQEGLALLVTPPADEKSRQKWKGPYTEDGTVPSDPWGTPYQYSVPGPNSQPFALYSFGADGKAGGEGIDADVGILPAGQKSGGDASSTTLPAAPATTSAAPNAAQ